MRKNKPAPTLSKSKIIAFRQCPKRLWLEVHRPDLRVDSAATEARFQVGHQVGEIARQLYDPAGDGVCMNIARDGFKAVFEQSRRLLDAGDRPVFEAGFKSSNTIALADVMIPATDGTRVAWKMVEVKSSTSVKDYHRDDAAVQSFLARAMGVPLSSVSVACINSSWVYPGGNDYRGLLAETDLTGETFERSHEVSSWISKARTTRTPPKPRSSAAKNMAHHSPGRGSEFPKKRIQDILTGMVLRNPLSHVRVQQQRHLPVEPHKSCCHISPYLFHQSFSSLQAWKSPTG
jgi:hypothetical protein